MNGLALITDMEYIKVGNKGFAHKGSVPLCSNKGHTISDFLGYISQLPEGHYEVINGNIVKR